MTQASDSISLQLEAEGVLVNRAKNFLESNLDALSIRDRQVEIPCHKV